MDGERGREFETLIVEIYNLTTARADNFSTVVVEDQNKNVRLHFPVSDSMQQVNRKSKIENLKSEY